MYLFLCCIYICIPADSYGETEPLATLPLVPGGKISLMAIGGIAVAVIVQGLLQRLHIIT
jgi:hypothetical protein